MRAENLHLQVTLLNSCIVNKEDVFFSFLEKKNAARKVLLAGIRDGLEGKIVQNFFQTDSCETVLSPVFVGFVSDNGSGMNLCER